ncbi:putative ovate protein family [Helianthus annuus]|nr:putative ovate protein family [Helianthus annuus]
MRAYNVANKSQNPNFHYLHTKPVPDVITEQQPFSFPENHHRQLMKTSPNSSRFFFPENHHHRQLIQVFSPKPQPFCSFLHKSKTHISRLNSNTNNNLFRRLYSPPFEAFS